MDRDDDLTPWRDTPLVQALTAPAEPAELAGEAEMLAAFRAARPRRRGRLAGHLGIGVTTLGVVVGLSGGVAAAYSSSLPDPLQTFAHAVLGGVGLPPPPPAHHWPAPAPEAGGGHRHGGTHPAGTVALPATTTTPGPVVSLASPAPKPAARPTAAAPTPSVSLTPAAMVTGTPTAPASAAPSAAASPSPSPSASPEPAQPDTLTGSLGRATVQVHSGDQVTGTLVDADGKPVADHWVGVFVHVAGTQGWHRQASRRTDSDGTMQAWLSDLTRNESVQLRAGNRVRSAAMRIVVRPLLTVSVSDGTQSDLVDVAADGGDPGDDVVLLRRENGQWRQVGGGSLDQTSHVQFSVTSPHRKARYAVRLLPTKLHGAAWRTFTVTPSS